MGIFARKTTAPTDNTRMVDLTKRAAVSLTKSGLSGHHAAVHLVLDHSGSMFQLYADGSVQHLAEQILGLAANLDDDGNVPVTFFSDTAYPDREITIGDHVGAIDRRRNNPPVPWGSTNYASAMRQVSARYRDCIGPVLVIFQTDGRPDSEESATDLIRRYSSRPIFWLFIGFAERNSSEMSYLRYLDDIDGRPVDNTGFFAVGERPKDVPDAALYDGITAQYALWLAAARAKGIVR